MTARYKGETVRIIAYAAKGDRSQIAYRGMLRWVRTSDLVTTPEVTMLQPAGDIATNDDRIRP